MVGVGMVETTMVIFSKDMLAGINHPQWLAPGHWGYIGIFQQVLPNMTMQTLRIIIGVRYDQVAIHVLQAYLSMEGI